MTKLVARLMSQHVDDAIPIGITDELIRKWEHRCNKIECIKDRDTNTQLAKRMDELVDIRHINSFDCQDINRFLERIQLEQLINPSHINLNPYIKFINDMTFSKCLFDFYAQVDEILSRLSPESQTIIERLAELSHPSQIQYEIMTSFSELGDPRLLNGHSELVSISLNNLTRSYQMEVAIYISHHIKSSYRDEFETWEQHKSFFTEQYHLLIYEPCDIIYEDLAKWFNFVLLSSASYGLEVNFQLDIDHSWCRFYTVCTILGHKGAHEHVYRYFMTHMNSRAPAIELNYLQTFLQVFFEPPPINDQHSFISDLFPEPRLRDKIFTIEPYQTLEDLKRLLDDLDPSYDFMINYIEVIRELINLSNVKKYKCRNISLNNRLQQVRNFDELGLNLRNIVRYMHYFNQKQFKVCEGNLYIAVSGLLREIENENLIHLEQLRRFLNDSERTVHDPFHRGFATFFHLYEYSYGVPNLQLGKFNSLLDKTCGPFLGNSYKFYFMSIVNNLSPINNQLAMNPMIMNFLKYESVCFIYKFKLYNYDDISRYLSTEREILPRSFREVWRTVSEKRFALSLNWLKS